MITTLVKGLRSVTKLTRTQVRGGRVRIVLLAATLVTGIIGSAAAIMRAIQFGWGTDFAVFQRTVSWPLDMLYHDAGPMPFLYPPPAILLFKPFAMLSSGFLTWSLVSLLAFVAYVSAISGKRVAILTLCSSAVVGGLVLGQVPTLLAAALFAGLKQRPFLGGLLWGAAASIKPHLMLFAPVALVVRRDWAMLAGMAAGVLIAFVASVTLFGFRLWLEWLEAAIGFGKKVAVTEMAVWNITPSGKAALLGLPAIPFLIGGFAIAVSTVAIAAKKMQGELLIALIIASSIVSSPYANAHDTIALIPACVVVLLRGPWWAVIPAAMVFVGTPFVTLVGLMSSLVAVGLWAIRSRRTETQKTAVSTTGANGFGPA